MGRAWCDSSFSVPLWKKKVEFPCNLFFLDNQQLVYAHKHIPSQVNNIELVLCLNIINITFLKKMKILKTQKEWLIFLVILLSWNSARWTAQFLSDIIPNICSHKKKSDYMWVNSLKVNSKSSCRYSYLFIFLKSSKEKASRHISHNFVVYLMLKLFCKHD